LIQKQGGLVDYAQRLHARGWVANHDGNITVRQGANRYQATPTATSKAAVVERSLLIVDDRGERVSGESKPFGELGLHLTVFKNRADVHAVMHAHPPYATALACAGSRLLEIPFMAEAVVSLGPSVPTVPFASPGAAACAAIAPYVMDFDAVLLGNHGVMTWGADLEQAFLRMELVEHLARVATIAQAVGGVKPLPDSAIPALLESRRKAGFRVPTTSAASGPRPVVACAPAPQSDVPILAPPSRTSEADVAALVREELVKMLRGSS
jgi:L-fuculose-phosphate aldolase